MIWAYCCTLSDIRRIAGLRKGRWPGKNEEPEYLSVGRLLAEQVWEFSDLRKAQSGDDALERHGQWLLRFTKVIGKVVSLDRSEKSGRTRLA